MASQLRADFRTSVNNREETNSVEIEQQERTAADLQKKKMKKQCNNRSITTERTDEENNNNNNSSTERQQITKTNNKNNNRFSLTEINRRCRNFIFRSSERPTLYSQIQPNKDNVNEEDEYCREKTIDKTERSDTGNNNNNKNDNDKDTENNKNNNNNNNNDNNEEQKRGKIPELCQRFENDSDLDDLDTENDIIPQQTIQSQTDASNNEDDKTKLIEQ